MSEVGFVATFGESWQGKDRYLQLYEVKNIPLQNCKIIMIMINDHAVLCFWGQLFFDRSFR